MKQGKISDNTASSLCREILILNIEKIKSKVTIKYSVNYLPTLKNVSILTNLKKILFLYIKYKDKIIYYNRYGMFCLQSDNCY